MVFINVRMFSSDDFQWLQTFRFWLFSHFALTSNVSNSSRCYMGSLNYVYKMFSFFFLKCDIWTYLMPQLVLKWRTSRVFGLNVVFFCYRTKLFTKLIYERERGRYFEAFFSWEIQSLYAPILPPFCGVSLHAEFVECTCSLPHHQFSFWKQI